ncbi:MAG: sigma-54 dependent transcriptional regulator [Desulfurivibrio sp.]|nr:sigma-54 dependent transcriptional regulator [Desulfurivibrio sp.]
MARVLIIDDDRMICDTLQALINSQGHEAEVALTLEEGRRQLAAGGVDLIFLDINLPDGSGLNAVTELRRMPASPEVIIITGDEEPDNAALAMKSDAWDYVRKPLTMQTVLLPLTRVLQYRQEKATHGGAPQALRRSEIIGNSPPLLECLDTVAKAAGTDASVLISGETGTGKELFARAIHANSQRAEHPFVVVDCAALPATLAESILFGHEKGTFTGADTARQGLLQQAHQGTLFLDEIGELPLELQKNLLRALQEQRFRPIGSPREVTSDFRVVAASNRDLEQMAADGAFRQDLLYRLQGFIIKLPPLRQRGDDINELAMAQLAKLSKHYRIPIKGVCSGFTETMQEYDWPGNIRELYNAVGQAFAQARHEPTLFAMHLPADIRASAKSKQIRQETEPDGGGKPAANRPAAVNGDTLPPMRQVREEALERAEYRYLQDLLNMVGHDLKLACGISQLSRSQLYRLLQKHQLRR